MSSPASKTDGTLTVLGVPEKLAEDLYGVSGSFKAFIPGISFPVRMTVIRLPGTRDLVVYSPFDPALVDISSLGTVKAVIAPNAMHSCYAQKFVAANPGSTLYSSPALAKRFPDRDWGTLVDDSCAPDVISPHVLIRVLSAFKMFQEIVVLHVPTASLIAADLAMNFSPSEIAKMNFGGRLFTLAVRATRPLDWSVILKWMTRSSCKEGLPQLDKLLDDWEWDRFVPCHGAVLEKDAKATFRDGTYRYVKTIAQEDSRVWQNVAAVALVVMAIGVAVKWRGRIAG